MREMTADPAADPAADETPRPYRGTSHGQASGRTHSSIRGSGTRGRGARRRGARGPGPSKLVFRLRRAWASPAVRSALLVYLPLTLLALAGWRIAASDLWRERIASTITTGWERLAARPEFAIRGVEVRGASPPLAALIRDTLEVVPGTSSLMLDLDIVRQRIERLGPVERATVRFDPAGMLVVSVTERVPAALFRAADGRLVVIDDTGTEIGPAGSRAAHPSLPVVLGAGAPQHIAEVEAILDSAPELVPRLRALVRVGGRRWDLVLEDGRLVMLPERDFLGALEWLRVRELEERLLERDIAVVDLRVATRPVVRLTPRAIEALRVQRALSVSGGKDT